MFLRKYWLPLSVFLVAGVIQNLGPGVGRGSPIPINDV